MLEQICAEVYIYDEFAIVIGADGSGSIEWIVVNKQGNVLYRNTLAKCICYIKRDVLKYNINRFKEVLELIAH